MKRAVGVALAMILSTIFGGVVLAEAQINISITMDQPGGNAASVQASNAEVVPAGFVVSPGAFSAGTYGCNASVHSSGCLYYAAVILLNPSGTQIASQQGNPACSGAWMRAEVYLDSNAQSGTYSCKVEASAQLDDGTYLGGYGYFDTYWGEPVSSISRARVPRFVRPLIRLD